MFSIQLSNGDALLLSYRLSFELFGKSYFPSNCRQLRPTDFPHQNIDNNVFLPCSRSPRTPSCYNQRHIHFAHGQEQFRAANTVQQHSYSISYIRCNLASTYKKSTDISVGASITVKLTRVPAGVTLYLSKATMSVIISLRALTFLESKSGPVHFAA